MARLGITVYLPPELEAAVLKAAKSKKMSASGLIAAAVKAQFDQNPSGLPEGATRQLARVEARLDKIVLDGAIMREAVLLYVRAWLEHNPPLSPEVEDSMAASADARFERYLDFIREGLEPGGSIMGDDVNGASATPGSGTH